MEERQRHTQNKERGKTGRVEGEGERERGRMGEFMKKEEWPESERKRKIK